jgi:hypothetical protein
MKVDDTDDHRMHAEYGEVSAADGGGAERRARGGRPDRLRRHHLAAAAGERRRREDGRDPALGRRDGDLHHARATASAPPMC